MKKVLIVLGILALMGCTEKGVTQEQNVRLTGGLSDCIYYKVAKGGGSNMHVIRCPNSSVTTNYRVGENNTASNTLIN